jgi:hypothetical protein
MPNDALKPSASETNPTSESISRNVGSPNKPLHGFVAVLDALGAASYSREDADRFLEARNAIMAMLASSTDLLSLAKEALKIFIFNDSIVLTYVRKDSSEFNGFCGLLRQFEMAFLAKRIFFRGAFSYGELYRVDEATNTVMGPAVSDAAAWYESADWIGIHATPRTTILVDSLLQRDPSSLDHVLVDYEVPLTGKGRVRLKAINWPKSAYLTFARDAQQAKAFVLHTFGSTRSLPPGAEGKYFNAIQFFDHCEPTFSPHGLTPNTTSQAMPEADDRASR